jgi:O-antigen/teichoic acid export membrane protein
VSQSRRLILEQVIQVIGVAVSLLDRLVLTGVLLRSWTVTEFEVWSVAGSVAGLLSLSEFGFNLYFSNQLMAEVENNNLPKAARVLAVANAVFLTCSGIALFTGLSALYFGRSLSTAPYSVWAPTVVMLAAGTALRIAICGQMALYRANRQYARLSLILMLGEVTRVGLTTLVVLLGGGACQAALMTLLVVLFGQVILVVVDSSHRFAPHHYSIRMPNRAEVRFSSGVSMAYFAHNIPVVLLTHAPVVILAYLHAEVGVIGGFVLVRTFTGLPRAVLQALAIVAGQECSRRLALRDTAGAALTLARAAKAFAVLSGLTAGYLLAGGSILGTLWTASKGDAFRPALLFAGLAPMILAPTSVLTHNVLACTNSPSMAASGRWLQLVIAVVGALVLPIPDLALRTLTAMSLGEIVGFAPPSYYGTAFLVPEADLRFHVRLLMTCLMAGIIGYGCAAGLLHWLPPADSLNTLCLAMGGGAVLCGCFFVALGLDRRSRSLVYETAFRLIGYRDKLPMD